MAFRDWFKKEPPEHIDNIKAYNAHVNADRFKAILKEESELRGRRSPLNAAASTLAKHGAAKRKHHQRHKTRELCDLMNKEAGRPAIVWAASDGKG